jgi:RHS repeat-associated protein
MKVSRPLALDAIQQLGQAHRRVRISQKIAGLSRQGYTFQTWLGQSMGLNHMNGRVEDAILGRFLSADPYIPDPGNAQSYNRYSYVNNNPMSLIDPSGFDDTCPSNNGLPTPGLCDGSGGSLGVNSSGAAGGIVAGGSSAQQNDANGNYTVDDTGQYTYTVCGIDCDDSNEFMQSPGVNTVPGLPFISTWPKELQPVTVTAVKLILPCESSSSWTDFLPHGAGGSVGYNVAAGVSNSRSAAKTGSYGGGQFFSLNTGPNQGTFTTYPGPISSSSALGASASGGASVFLTNAQSVQQLGGPFTTDSVDIGLGPYQFSWQLYYGGGIWAASLSLGPMGLTFGASGSKTTTNTVINSQSSNGCY